MTGLYGATCVVTGASSGIGRALALSFARGGGRVWALARREHELRELAEESADGPGRAIPVVADLSLDDDVESAARAILSDGGPIDVLVHCAGAIGIGGFDSLPVSELDRQYRVNLRAPFMLTQALLPALRQARGQVVFVNSSAGLSASANNVLYAATKHGLRAVADGLRKHVNPDGMRVVSVYLGRAATPMQELVHEREGRPYRAELLLQPEDVVSVVLGALSVPRGGEVTDVHVRSLSKAPTP